MTAPLPPKADFVLAGDLLKAAAPENEIQDPKTGDKDEETACSITCQVFIPFMIAGMGTVAAGLLLDIVQVGAFFLLITFVI